MSNKNINFYQQWATDGIQSNQYSPKWFVEAENLDIFSNWQCLQATAWSEPVEYLEKDYVDVCHKKRMYLKSNWRVWDDVEKKYLTNPDEFNANANLINYTNLYSWDYERASFWTPKKILVKYENNNWKTISVFTDRMIYNYYKDKIKTRISVPIAKNVKDYNKNEWVNKKYIILESQDKSKKTMSIHLSLLDLSLLKGWFEIRRRGQGDNDWKIKSLIFYRKKLNYNNKDSSFWAEIHEEIEYPIDSNNDLSNGEITTINTYIDNISDNYVWYWACKIEFETNNNDNHFAVVIGDICYTESFEYLKPEERKIIETNGNFYINNKDNYYNCYNYQKCWTYSYIKHNYDTYYLLNIQESVNFIENIDIVTYINWINQNYIFANSEYYAVMYSVQKGSLDNYSNEVRFYWKKIINAVYVKWLIYILAEERGVRGFYVYYSGELKLLHWELYQQWENSIVNNKIKFWNKMINYRDNIVISTEDNRIFMRGLTQSWLYAGSFVGEVEGEIKELVVEQDLLKIIYKKDGKTYEVFYQDKIVNKNYKKNFSITYPKIIWTHYLEKDPQDIIISYMQPNNECSIDLWISVNDFYFWSFETETEIENGKYTIEETEWNYYLEFLEKHENKITFKLVGDKPIKTNTTPATKLIKVEWDWPNEIIYSKVDNFRYIGRVDKWAKIGKDRFTSISDSDDIPYTHTIQLKITGKTNWKASPEIYSFYFLASQNDR